MFKTVIKMNVPCKEALLVLVCISY